MKDSTREGIDEETMQIITSSVSLLDWRRMTINITPPVEERVSGGYVAVEILYTVPMPRLEIPLGFTDDPITIMGPIQLRAVSRQPLES